MAPDTPPPPISSDNHGCTCALLRASDCVQQRCDWCDDALFGDNERCSAGHAWLLSAAPPSSTCWLDLFMRCRWRCALDGNWLILIPAVDPAQTCVSMCVTVQTVKYETHFLSCSLLSSPFSFSPSSRGQCQLRALPPLTHHLFILTYLSKLIFFTCINDKTLKLYRVALFERKKPTETNWTQTKTCTCLLWNRRP